MRCIHFGKTIAGAGYGSLRLGTGLGCLQKLQFTRNDCTGVGLVWGVCVEDRKVGRAGTSSTVAQGPMRLWLQGVCGCKVTGLQKGGMRVERS